MGRGQQHALQSPRQMTADHIYEIGHKGIAGKSGERHMEFQVQGRKTLSIAQGSLHLGKESFQPVDFLFASVQSCVRSGQTFQRTRPV